MILALGVRALASTWRVRRTDAHLLDEAQASGGAVLALFHEHLLTLGALHRHRSVIPLASLSADGELLARVLTRIGYTTIRGSTRRGAVGAARAVLKALERGSPALAVDGPRGPRRTVQRGAVALAAASGRPLVLVAARATPSVRLGSWDRLQIPLPFARVDVRYGRMDGLRSGREAEERAAQDLGIRLAALATIPGPAG